MGKTKIEWCEKSWNPITGCSPVSEGCQNCYARRMSNRLKGRYGYPKDEPFKVTFHPDRLEDPLHWKRPSRIFVCSMGDLFHEDVDDNWLDCIIGTIRDCPQHIFMVLTKRPSNLKRYFESWRSETFKNLFLGVSIENQPRANERILELLKIPAAKRFVSVEPMLGPVDFRAVDLPPNRIVHPDHTGLQGISWIICGGETGPKARPMNPDWAKDLARQCKVAGVPFFFKQMSGKLPIPKDLMIREFPK